jgi:uncharacterized protein involved in cysteine biosynthesis
MTDINGLGRDLPRWFRWLAFILGALALIGCVALVAFR